MLFLKAIILRIKVSYRRFGLMVTAKRCVLAPYYLVLAVKSRSEYDRKFGVSTDTMALLEDLEIPSPNRVHGTRYEPTPASTFAEALNSLDLDFSRFTFVDFGSGKGRAVIMASAYPFSKILGIEFSPELHRMALENLRHCDPAFQKCKAIALECADFSEFSLPHDPLVCYFYNPCDEHLMEKTAHHIARSCDAWPRPVFVVYCTPLHADVFLRAGFELQEKNKNVAIYFRDVEARPMEYAEGNRYGRDQGALPSPHGRSAGA